MQFGLLLHSIFFDATEQLLERVWDDLCCQSGDIKSPEWRPAILKQRQQEFGSLSMTVSPWSEAKERLHKLGRETFFAAWDEVGFTV